jgi:hypothetical protein
VKKQKGEEKSKAEEAGEAEAVAAVAAAEAAAAIELDDEGFQVGFGLRQKSRAKGRKIEHAHP